MKLLLVRDGAAVRAARRRGKRSTAARGRGGVIRAAWAGRARSIRHKRALGPAQTTAFMLDDAPEKARRELCLVAG